MNVHDDPITLSAVPCRNGHEDVEFGIDWSDGLFSGPFSTQEAAEEYVRDTGPGNGVTAEIITREVGYGAWTAVTA